MSTSYLSIQGTAQANGQTGLASVTLKPDVGQYWTPKICRVSLNINSYGTIPIYCALYHGPAQQPPFNVVGPVNGSTNAATFLDDTFAGQGDASGVMSGTVVSPGEAITARWFGVPTSATATLAVYGETSNTPPGVGISVPDLMGPTFAGKAKAFPPWEPPPQYSIPISFNNPGPGNSVVIFNNPYAALPQINAALYLHTMRWNWSAGNSAAHGLWQLNGPSSATIDVDNVGDPSQRYMDYKGYRIGVYNVGLTWFQGGALAANTISCAGVVNVSYMPYYSIT